MNTRILAFAAATMLSFSAHAAQVGSLDPSGATVSENKAIATSTVAENSNKGVDELLLKYPEVAHDIAILSTIDRAVYTDKGTIDLYAADKLIIILAQKENVWTVSQSVPLFMPTSTAPMMSQVDLNLLKQIEFTFRGCSANQGVETCETVRSHTDFEKL